MKIDQLYTQLKYVLRDEIRRNNLVGENVSITCKALTPKEAIGEPEHDDYPIIKGREVMVEASFKGAKGHAFSDEYENMEYSAEELTNLRLDNNRERASFIAGFNAIFRYLGLCDKTVHCKDNEPVECAAELSRVIKDGSKVLLIGFQPRFLEAIAKNYPVRAIDLDEDNIGKKKFGVTIEPPENTDEAIEWCDMIFATGSTLINGTITTFLDADKPTLFYGTTISAAATILYLDTYCYCGH